MRPLILTLALCLAAFAQIKRTEVVKATTPAEDAKGLTPGIPDSVAVSTQFERIVVIRMRHQADLLAEIEKQVKEQKIENAVILSGIGSVISTHYHMVSNRTFPSKNLFLENEKTTADIISMNGYVFNGRVHPHITFADSEKSFGGHLEARNKVFTFAIVTLGVLPASVNMTRFDDKTMR